MFLNTEGILVYNLRACPESFVYFETRYFIIINYEAFNLHGEMNFLVKHILLLLN